MVPQSSRQKAGLQPNYTVTVLKKHFARFADNPKFYLIYFTASLHLCDEIETQTNNPKKSNELS